MQLLKGVDMPAPELSEFDQIVEGRKLLDGPPGGGRGRGGGMNGNDGLSRTSQHVQPVGGGLVGTTPLGRMLAAGLSGPPGTAYGGIPMGGYGAGNAGMATATAAYGVGYRSTTVSSYAGPPQGMGGGGGYGGQYGAQSGGYGPPNSSYPAAPMGGYSGGYGAAPPGANNFGNQRGGSLLHQLGGAFGSGWSSS